MDNEDAERMYIVLINDAGQYSLWPKEKQIPAGWRATGTEGTKSHCMEYVDSVWLDMKPKVVAA